MLRILLAVSAAFTAALLWSAPAMAVFLPDYCSAPFGCELDTNEGPDGSPPFDGMSYGGTDYTIVGNATTLKWTLILDQPSATVSLQSPNDVLGHGTRMTAQGLEGFVELFDYRFDEIVQPGRTVIFTWAPRDIPNTCSPSTPVGQTCWLFHQVYGNGASTTFTGTQGKFNLRITVEAVPEPSAWALMILGFGAIGATLRAGRRQVARSGICGKAARNSLMTA